MSATRIYANRGLARRQNISTIVVLSSLIFGGFEIWRAANVAPDQVGSGYLFALLFLGGGVYGVRTVLMGSMDSVVAFDMGPSPEATVMLWRPFTTKRLEGSVEKLNGWRPYAKQMRKSFKQPMVLADHPDYPRPLEFYIGPGIVFGEEFRALAGEALEGIEARTAAQFG